MHTMKLTKIGSGTGMILPVGLLSTLGVEKGDSLHLTKAPGGYRLTPYNPEFEAQMAAAQEVTKKRRDALRALAR